MFRRANREELTQLRRSFDKWGIFEFMEAQQLMIKEDRTITNYYKNFKRHSQPPDIPTQIRRLSSWRATKQEILTLFVWSRGNCEA
jgi:hypothetical protein